MLKELTIFHKHMNKFFLLYYGLFIEKSVLNGYKKFETLKVLDLFKYQLLPSS